MIEIKTMWRANGSYYWTQQLAQRQQHGHDVEKRRILIKNAQRTQYYFDITDFEIQPNELHTGL